MLKYRRLFGPGLIDRADSNTMKRQAQELVDNLKPSRGKRSRSESNERATAPGSLSTVPLTIATERSSNSSPLIPSLASSSDGQSSNSHIPTRLSNVNLVLATHDYQEKEQQLDPHYQVKPQDVICGQRGSKDASSKHSGNERFRVIVEMKLPSYRAADNRVDKTQIVRQIVDIVRQTGGRFVRQEEGVWYDIGNLRAREKAGHALRGALTKTVTSIASSPPLDTSTNDRKFNSASTMLSPPTVYKASSPIEIVQSSSLLPVTMRSPQDLNQNQSWKMVQKETPQQLLELQVHGLNDFTFASASRISQPHHAAHTYLPQLESDTRNANLDAIKKFQDRAISSTSAFDNYSSTFEMDEREFSPDPITDELLSSNHPKHLPQRYVEFLQSTFTTEAQRKLSLESTTDATTNISLHIDGLQQDEIDNAHFSDTPNVNNNGTASMSIYRALRLQYSDTLPDGNMQQYASGERLPTPLAISSSAFDRVSSLGSKNDNHGSDQMNEQMQHKKN